MTALSISHFFSFNLSFTFTQSIQAQLNVTMVAVATTLVSHESPCGPVQEGDRGDPTVDIGYNDALWV